MSEHHFSVCGMRDSRLVHLEWQQPNKKTDVWTMTPELFELLREVVNGYPRDCQDQLLQSISEQVAKLEADIKSIREGHGEELDSIASDVRCLRERTESELRIMRTDIFNLKCSSRDTPMANHVVRGKTRNKTDTEI